MKIGVYPGSFDPITNGHLDIIKRASNIFDTVIIAVACNINKKEFLDTSTRISLINECTSDIKNIKIVQYTGLTVDFAKKVEASCIIRGLRNSNDFEFEKDLAQTNMALDSSIETITLYTKPDLSYISSSMVKELIVNNGNVESYVPQSVSKYLKTIMK